MRITCLVDSLNSGGAQRQICMLAILLKQRGYDVQILTYHNFDFFNHLLESKNIPFNTVSSKNKIHRLWSVRKSILEINPDLVISFLNIPSLIAEINRLPLRKYKLIVSERNIEPLGLTFKNLTRFMFHVFADAVVANSYAKSKYIKKTAPWLKNKINTITNCVDLETFRPSPKNDSFKNDHIHLLVIGRLEPQKNPMALLSGLKILKKQQPNLNVVVEWYGNNFFRSGQATRKSWLFLEMQQKINEAGFQGVFRIHQPHQDVVKLYWNASVVCLPSLWEGCSNVICEAMACGKPILASRVGDNEVLVEDGVNGLLFDPKSPQSIADSILRFASLSLEERKQMGINSRQRAESMLAPLVFVDKYINLIEDIG